MTFKSDRVTWYRPTLLNDLLELKYKYPTARLVVGNTEIGQCVKIHYYRHHHHTLLKILRDFYSGKIADFEIGYHAF